MTETAKMWEGLLRQEFSAIDDSFLRTFRAPGSANRFVAWSPYERSSRYLKFLLLTVAQRQSAAFFDAYRMLGACSLGNPISVKCGGCDINADYLAAVEEWEFLNDLRAFEGVTTVVEIGAGFGRTCHALLKLCPGIVDYAIVDLEPMLELSRSYLRQAAPEVFHRIRFVGSGDQAAQAELKPDLAINIDSFQEMPPATIDGYMQRLVVKADRFYCKNAVGKYLPESVGLADPNPAGQSDVFALGYCTNVIDVFNADHLSEARALYLAAYRPRTDDDRFVVAGSKAMELFPYFLHALYVRR
jgi:putative sugar O-methyltransferase